MAGMDIGEFDWKHDVVSGKKMLAFIGNSLQGVFKMGSVEMSNRWESDC